MTITSKITTLMSGAVMAALILGSMAFGNSASAAAPQWDVSGDYVVAFNYLGTDYAHDMHLNQSADGDLTGSGGSPAGSNSYMWVIASGTVSGDTVDFYADYTATADAVTPQTTMHVMGTVSASGTISGTWTDNYQGGVRSGTFHSTSGMAEEINASLAAQDFGVVSYDTGLGMLKGYTAGFGLTNDTFEDVQSVVVKLYAGNTLLQTNTATAKVGDTVTGSQISSPFDVSGNFDYTTDGYWVNDRESEYGQTLAATRVVATVTLDNGTVLTAENTNLTGDPSTIMPDVVPPSTPTKDACKNGGWKNFTNPSYKNQGQCVSAANKNK